MLTAVGRTYEGAWRAFDRFRANRGQPNFMQWPEWCFVPLSGAYAVVSGGGNQRVPPERAHHTAVVGAMGAWRVTQGIYRIDPALYKALLETPITPELPIDPLYRLPEWCVYVETPGLSFMDRALHGVWAHLDYCPDRPDELRMVLDVARDVRNPFDAVDGLVPFLITLGSGSLADAIQRVIQSGFERLGIDPPTGTLATRAANAFWPIISVLLYLCAADADLGAPRPARPTPTRTKRGLRLFAPDVPRHWDVGVRMGAALRSAYAAAQLGESSSDPSCHVRPHVRVAHWHTFVLGPRSQPERQRRDVRWLPPIAVNVNAADDLPAVIRTVRDSAPCLVTSPIRRRS